MYAYVTTLYGSNIYLTGAIVMGYSLMKTKTPHHRIIMVTPDVDENYKIILRELYTHVIDIEYMPTHKNIFKDENTRFINVFTKLLALTLIDYDKIILLDTDMIICQNIDHLFLLEPPAACIIYFSIPYGEKIDKNIMCTTNKKLKTSINAGLMLLKPDINEFNSIKEDINKENQPIKFRNPEQEYLSLRYCGKWTSITFNYNFQFGLKYRVSRNKYTASDIYVIHYSGFKPWGSLFKEIKPKSSDKIKYETENKKYYDMWLSLYNHVKEKLAEKNLIVDY